MIAGGCRCGAVRYTLARDDLPAVYCCHCLDCQTWSASAFTEQAPVRDGEIAVEGPVAEYAFISPSGSTSRQFVCGTCHTRIYNTNTARPGLAIVRAGTLEDSARIVPRMHIWVERKQSWIVIGEDVPQFEQAPSTDEFMRIMLD